MNKFNKSTAIIDELMSLSKAGNTSLMDAALHYAERNNHEVEFIADIIRESSLARAIVEEEAESLNLLKTKTSRLPI